MVLPPQFRNKTVPCDTAAFVLLNTGRSLFRLLTHWDGVPQGCFQLSARASQPGQRAPSSNKKDFHYLSSLYRGKVLDHSAKSFAVTQGLREESSTTSFQKS